MLEDKQDPAKITEKQISNYLYNPKMPDPDLVIRTSGEQRLSNFLLWQSAYSEFLFLKEMWPDFNKKASIERLENIKTEVEDSEIYD